MSALRSRCVRHGWSGKLPRASQCCQWCAVHRSRLYASSYVRAARARSTTARRTGGRPFLHQRAGDRPRPLEAEAQVGRQPQLDVGARGFGDALVVVAAGVGPLAGLAAVVEARLALQHELHLAVDAAHRAQQHVIGVVVGRRPAVRVRHLVLVVPGPDEQHVAHDDPAGRRAPARLEHHRAREVPAGGGNGDVVGAEAEAAGAAVEDRDRTRSANRSAAGTSIRRCPTARRARTSRSRTGTPAPRSEGRPMPLSPGPS